MPDREVKTIQDLIYYQYAALREKFEPPQHFLSKR
jgi:hypothetical protein